MSKMIGPQGRMAAMKHAQDFTHPTAKSLPEFDDKIARYQSYVDALKAGKVVGLDDPKKAQDTMQTALDTLVSGHNQLMADLIKQKAALASTRFVKLTLSDGSERVMTGPEAVNFTRGSDVLVKDATPIQGAPGQPGQPGAGNPNKPHAVNPSFSASLQMATMPDGRQVAGSPAELSAAGLAGQKVGESEATQIRAARQLVAPNGLFASIAQDISELDKKGMLGVVASRWNEFMTSKVGIGPDFVKLRNDLRLSSTRLMQAHVGLKGSNEMLEHFGTLADYKISDAATLKSALSSEFKYALERAAFIPQK